MADPQISWDAPGANTVPAINWDTAPAQPGAISRFLDRATGLPVSDIVAHPGAYLNPFSSETTPTRDAFQHAAQHPEEMSGEIHIPGKQTYQDIKAKNYAGAAGDVLPTALTLASLAGGGFGNAGQPEVIPPNAVPPRLTGEVAPTAIPRAPEPAPTPYRYGPGAVTPEIVGQTNPNVLAGNQGTIVRPLRMLNGEVQPPEAAPAPASQYRNLSDLNGYKDYLDDQGVIEGMRKDLYMQAKAGGRQAREEFEAGNSMDKPKYVRQAEAEAQQIMDKASHMAQQHVQDTIDKFNRPLTSKNTPAPQTTKPQDLEQTLRESIAQAQAAKNPVKVDFDQNGNVVDADGRHRVIEALKRGDPTIAVQTKLADGSVQTLRVAPEVVARKMGVTPESLKVTDEQQMQFQPKMKKLKDLK